MPAPLNQEEKDARLIERLKLDLSRSRGMVKTLQRRGGMTFESSVDSFIEFLKEEGAQKFVLRTKTYPKFTKQSSIFDKDHSEIAALTLSDWHTGEVIRLEDTNGMNKFNSLVASNRIWTIIDKFKRIVRGHQQMYTIKSIWLPLLGDFISGSIREEFVLTNDLLDVPASILAARLLIMAVEELKTLGIPIKIDCVVGNHARLLAKMPAKRQAHLSFDWLVFEQVKNYFEHDKQVAVTIHTSILAIVELYNHRIVIQHGSNLTNGNEKTYESRLRDIFDSPVYREATGLQGTAVSLFVCGDKHVYKCGENFLVNGCLTGQNEYGQSLQMKPIGCIQAAWGISKNRAPTWVYPLDASKTMSERVDNSFSEYTSEFMKKHGRCS